MQPRWRGGVKHDHIHAGTFIHGARTSTLEYLEREQNKAENFIWQKVMMGSASVIPLEAKHHKIVSGGEMSAAQQPHHVWWSLFELGHINHCSVRWRAEIKADSCECEEQAEGRTGFLQPARLKHDHKGSNFHWACPPHFPKSYFCPPHSYSLSERLSYCPDVIVHYPGKHVLFALADVSHSDRFPPPPSGISNIGWVWYNDCTMERDLIGHCGNPL